MRIVMDLQGAQTESRFRGIGRYSTALAQAILKRAGSHDVWIALNANLVDSVGAVHANFRHLIEPSKIIEFHGLRPTAWIAPENVGRRATSFLARESFISELRPDIVHISSLFEGSQDDAVVSIGKLPTGGPTAVTLYDLIPLLNQRDYLGYGWARDWYMDKVESLRRAELLLAISDHAKQEAVSALKISGDNIVNISSAISDHFKPMPFGVAERARLDERFGLRQPYIMYSGAIEPRKNVDRLLQAFAVLLPQLRSTHQLVVSGRVLAPERERLLKLAAGLGIADRLVLTDYVEENELLALYGGCALYVFPSLHEGFGLPALEAMACGVPTIGSSTTSVPEVIGRTDALFDPSSVDEIAAAISRGLTDEGFNRSLREHAPVQAAKFSWDETARRTISAFESVHERRGHRAVFNWSQAWSERHSNYEGLIATIAAEVQTNQPFSAETVELPRLAEAIARNQETSDQILRMGELPSRITWRIEGPFDSSYSLALLNRETALALDRLGNHVVLHSTEGPGDFPASEAFLAANPQLALLHSRAQTIPPMEADVSSRLLYPPRVHDMRSRFNLLHHYAWEESGFPSAWVDEFNDGLQGMTLLSRHVEKIMIDNGVDVPMMVSGSGVDHWDRIVADSAYTVEARGFRFLHVSSCFPRKGVDVLIRAFGASFTNADDVSLIIKTFANPHNRAREWLANASSGRRDFPHVVIIEEDLNDGQLKNLYATSDVLVAPSRAEGLGLPMAEAMMSGLSVITTGWGGQTDFCNEQTAWLIDYKFEPAETHFGIFNSVWAEPDEQSLARVMIKVFHSPKKERLLKVERGRALLRESFTWDMAARRLDRAVRTFAQELPPQAPHVGWISTWNTPCGIASYSAHLVSNTDVRLTVFGSSNGPLIEADATDVVRCWNSGGGDSLERLSEALDAARVNAIVLQFQYSFFDFGALSRFLLEQSAIGRVVAVMMHATVDPPEHPHMKLAKLVPALAACDRVLVHAPADLNRLKGLGLVENVTLFPHGVLDAPIAAPKEAVDDFTIMSYGFYLPHKGLDQLIEATALLRDRGHKVVLKMINAEYPVPVSRDLVTAGMARIEELGLGEFVTIVSEFLPDEASLAHLADADLIVFPYQGTGESSSAAVRYGLATGRPIAVTPLAIFDDVKKAVFHLPGTTPKDIASGIETFMFSREKGDTASIVGIMESAEKWREAHRYSALARRLQNMLRQLVRRRLQNRQASSTLQ